MSRLSISMIVKNEEGKLPSCLESVKCLTDDIVLVDTGSTDRTEEIARSYGAKIYEYDWCQDFSAARNYALSLSQGDWILYLDADEILDPSSVEEIRDIIRKKSREAYLCNVFSQDSSGEKPNQMRYPRLFKNSGKLRFEGRIHEQLVYSLQRNKYRIKESGIKILHTGYDLSKEELEKKAERNLRLLLEDYKTDKSGYNVFQIAQSYAALGDYQTSSAYFKEVLGIKGLQAFYYAHAFRNLAAYALLNGRIKEAAEYADSGLLQDKYQPMLNFTASKIYMRLGDYAKALFLAKRAYQANNLSRDGKDFEIYTDNRNIVYLGLKESVLCKSAVEFNYFFELLKGEYPDDVNDQSLVKFIFSLFNNEPIEEKNFELYLSYLNEGNLDLMLALIENYDLKEVALRLLLGALDKFSSSPLFLNCLGTTLYQMESYKRAEPFIERSLDMEFSDPVLVFKLISVYLMLNHLDRIPGLIIKAEKTFGDVPEIGKRLHQLKSQISEYVEIK